MPLEPLISLQGKPVQIEHPKATDLFKTLAQMRYLGAEAQAAEQEAARKQALFDETAAAGHYLSSLGKGSAPTPTAPPQPGVTGGPPFSDADLRGLQQGESTPPPGTPVPAGPAQGVPGQPPAAPPRPSLLDATVRAAIYQRAPHAAADFIKSGLDIESLTTKAQTDQLELGAKFLEHAGRTLALVHDPPSYEAWKLSMAPHIPQALLAQLPATFSPDLVTRLQQSTQAVADQVEHKLKQQRVANETMNAESQRISAETGQQTVQLHGREYIPIQTEDGYKLVPKYAPAGGGGGTGAGGTGSVPPVVDVPDSGRPRTAEETKAAARFDQAAKSNARLALLEAEIASLGTDPSQDPPRNAKGELGPGKGKGLSGIVPSVGEDALARSGGVFTALGGALGVGLGTKVGGVYGGARGGQIGTKAGEALDATGIGENVAHGQLNPRRQSYYGEQLNFIAAVRGEETSRLTPEDIEIERRRYFPQPGDSEAEVLRKRQVREEALSGLATQTNRRQGSVPVGQKRVDEGSGTAAPGRASEPPGARQTSPDGRPPTPPASPHRTVTMEEMWRTAREYGLTIDQVMADVWKRGWTIKH
jgi:hypothetical protein